MEFILNELIQQVMTARAARRPLMIRGGGSKAFYGEPLVTNGETDHATLDMSSYAGIVNYEPSELVITARAGTLLSEIEQTLAEKQQILAFEPPRLAPNSTWGGCIASGLSGPRRMSAGSVRDFVLGAQLLDSGGTVLNFGGEVMKNVAGYDVSRLLTGSMGVFGPLLQVSAKVVPKPAHEVTLTLQATETQALSQLNQWRSLPLPISATAWCPAEGLKVRLSGSEPAVQQAQAELGGVTLDNTVAAAFWDALRDQTHACFQQRPLWRVALPPTAPALVGYQPSLIEWQGGLRWLTDVASPTDLRQQVQSLGGHACLYRYDTKPDDVPVFHPLPPAVKSINWRLKQALDPIGIFNPKRLFPDF